MRVALAVALSTIGSVSACSSSSAAPAGGGTAGSSGSSGGSSSGSSAALTCAGGSSGTTFLSGTTANGTCAGQGCACVLSGGQDPIEVCLAYDGGGGWALPDLDTPCATGVTGREVLARLRESYGATLSYPHPAPDGGQLGPTALTITADFDGGVSCAPGVCSCGSNTSCQCGDSSLSLGIVLGFRTADGQFDEHLPASASAAASCAASLVVTVQASVLASELGGTFQVPFGTPAEETLAFTATLDLDGGTTGQVDESGTANGAVSAIDATW